MSIQTIEDLITQLEDFDPQTPVASATQPGWPFECSIAAVVQSPDGMVYLVEGAQTRYLPNGAREAIGW